MFTFANESKINMKYEVSGIFPKQYDNEIAGGDSETINIFRHKSKAFFKSKA